jgi:undecaprenyl diphosphate synthase
MVPKHVAIIMDGNGRWAQRRGHPRVFGHVRGSSRIKSVARAADRLGIKALTLYAFSTENWKRPEAEKQVLWRLLKKFLLKERAELNKENVRLHVIGEPERLDPEVRAILDETIHMLSKNTGLQLTFALSYGSRREIARAAQLFAQECVEGRRTPQEMTEELFGQYLWTAPLGELQDVDLVIRTSGEKRVSNYLLWQSAYAEYLFPEVSWPDFSPEHLEAAVEEFAGRSRRFGATGEQIVHTSV